MLCHEQRAYEVKGCNLFSPCVSVGGMGGTVRVISADKEAAIYDSPSHRIRNFL